MKKNPEVKDRVLARVFAKDLKEIIAAADDYKDLGTTPSDGDSTASEAATSESFGTT